MMAQSHLAANNPIPPEASEMTAQTTSTAVNGRTSAQQAEIERIGKTDTYCKLDRDDDLFTWLNDQRDLRLRGYIISPEWNGLPKACEYYRMAHVKRRGSLFQIPATVFYVKVNQKGNGIDLYRAILEEFSHPLSNVGSLSSLRSRVWDNFKRYGVKILIIGNADDLKLEAFNELLDLYASLRISVVLAETNQLESALSRNNPAYTKIANSFLE
jgi:DNA transposition AAA+ family ATPase